MSGIIDYLSHIDSSCFSLKICHFFFSNRGWLDGDGGLDSSIFSLFSNDTDLDGCYVLIIYIFFL